MSTSVAALLLPDVLPYRLHSPAGYTFAAQNGRCLTDDVMDVMLTLLTNHPISDHVDSDHRFQPDFPYVAEPHLQPEDMPSIFALAGPH